MKNLIFSIIFIILFVGCSFKINEKYKYRVNASNSFESYKRYYLKGETRLASIALKRALQSAKSGTDVNAIARIYLGECALHNALLIEDRCKQYNSIKQLIPNNKLDDYYNLLQNNIGHINIKYLPSQYKNFIKNLKNKNYKNAFKSIQNMQTVTSKLIAASIIKNELTKKEIKYIIKISSSIGYKHATLRWYELLKEKSTPKERKTINKKIAVFVSKP